MKPKFLYMNRRRFNAWGKRIQLHLASVKLIHKKGGCKKTRPVPFFGEKKGPRSYPQPGRGSKGCLQLDPLVCHKVSCCLVPLWQTGWSLCCVPLHSFSHSRSKFQRPCHSWLSICLSSISNHGIFSSMTFKFQCPCHVFSPQPWHFLVHCVARMVSSAGWTMAPVEWLWLISFSNVTAGYKLCKFITSESVPFLHSISSTLILNEFYGL